MINLESLNDEIFYIEHLSSEENIKGFTVNNSKGKGLELYFRKYAINDENENIARTYVIKDNITREIVAYFTLRSGLITVSRGLFKGFDAITGIELANFAVNDNYRTAHDVIPKLGSYVFFTFILPLVKEISNYVGAMLLYIYALPEDKLMAHYETMGFSRTSEKMERFVYRHVKPAYDKDCIFMVRKIF